MYKYIIFEREKKTNNRRRIISTERRAHVTFTSRHIIAETGRRPIDMATNRKYRSTHLHRCPSYYYHHYYHCCDVRCSRPCYMRACVCVLCLVYSASRILYSDDNGGCCGDYRGAKYYLKKASSSL